MRRKSICKDCGHRNYGADIYCRSCSSDLNQEDNSSKNLFLNLLSSLVMKF